MAKTEFLHIRLSREDKRRVAAAARATHLDASTWARMVILKAVEEVERKEEKGISV